MTTRLSDLPLIEDVLNTLVFEEKMEEEEEPSIFSDENALELVETAFHLMEEFMEENPNAISDPHFHDNLLEEIKEMFYVQMEDHILKTDFVEDDMNDILEYAFNIYITTFHIERSIAPKVEDQDKLDEDKLDEDKLDEDEDLDKDLESFNSIYNLCLKNGINEKIQTLRDMPQPVQRTPEWYTFRWNLITASNAWKAFETQCTINQLIYEKCQPLNTCISEEIKMVNTNTPMHWGQKYEPLSVMMYEQNYGSKVEDFGCIQHQTYKFIGASPDGIVIESDTGRFGRMLEIKNIVNRVINGIPKKEYWVQMQLQMEVCDLDECDFLETKFTEYSDFHAYENDSIILTCANDDNEEPFNSFVTAKNLCSKGIIIHFHTKIGSPFYAYMPLNIWTPHDVSEWEEQTINKYSSAPYNYAFLKFIYWKLEILSCVLVLRNKEWFRTNVGQLQNVWNLIEKERVTGYEHRAPKKKPKKELLSKSSYDNSGETCYLKIIKLDN
jgi:putative phage-type endonuclease